jgi:hypothetical protein
MRCTLCGTENPDLAITCSSCKGYLQAKIDTLDLFTTLWDLIESPGMTFKKIVLARHKNYVLLLSSILGLTLCYGAFWYKNVGQQVSSLFLLLVTGIVAGPPIGILFTTLLSLGLLVAGKSLGGEGIFKNIFAVSAYASFPLAFGLFFVFPLELSIFGIQIFDANPSPMVINPILYVTLLGFDCLLALWAVVLLVRGTAVAHSLSRVRAATASLSTLACMFLLLFGVSRWG